MGAAGDAQSFAAKTAALVHLAAALHSQKCCAEAVPILEDVLRRQRLSIGEDPPRVTMAKLRLATCLYDIGSAAEAFRLAEEARQAIMLIRERELPIAIPTCQKLAELFGRMQDADQAEMLLRRRLAIAATLPPNAESLNCALALAEHLSARSRDAEVDELLARTVQSAQSGVLADHPLTATCRRSWGQLSPTARTPGRSRDATSRVPRRVRQDVWRGRRTHALGDR